MSTLGMLQMKNLGIDIFWFILKEKKDEIHGQKTNISKIMKQKTRFIKTWFIIEA